MSSEKDQILIDLTEFVFNPVYTGIQRVVRKLVQFWPESAEPHYAYVDYSCQQFVEIPRSALHRLADLQEALPRDEIQTQIYSVGKSIPTGRLRRILVPEVFYDERRVKFYKTLLRRDDVKVCFLVYDFMPFLNPSVYRVTPSLACTIMPYLMLIKKAQNRAFISSRTKADFLNRVMRRQHVADGPIFNLGADSLDMAKQQFDPRKRNLLCIGTFEGKKHQEIVFRAFRSLGFKREDGWRLIFLGSIPTNLAPWLQEIVNYGGEDIVVVKAPSDEELRNYLSTAAATIFVSTNEGFGLPAIESLHCGIPVLTYAHLPSTEQLNGLGQIVLHAVTVDSVKAGITHLVDPRELERLWNEAATLDLPTWKDFSSALANWALSVGSASVT